MAEVLDLDPSDVADDTWRSFALFDRAGRCVANVDAAILPLVAGGTLLSAAAIRSVAVAPQWRGRGLFRDLMGEALDWCDARSAGLTLLYTAEPSIYRPFGFHLLAQHAFIGPAPPPEAAAPAVPLDLSDARHRAIVARIAETREPVSKQAALLVPASLALANLADADSAIAFAEDLDTVIVHERRNEDDGDTLVLVDVIASRMPALPRLLGALGHRPRRIKTLFPPDRLGWRGEPVEEDAGLMARGPLPEAMTRPFMFPPTSEF